MDIHGKPIDQRIDWLFEHARDYSARFCSPENWLARERYRALHPTAIAVLKCMDGRINIPVAANTPLGIIQPLLASVPYEELGVDRARAELKSAFLADFAAGVIAAQYPALAEKMHVRKAVLDWRARRLEQLAPSAG